MMGIDQAQVVGRDAEPEHVPRLQAAAPFVLRQRNEPGELGHGQRGTGSSQDAQQRQPDLFPPALRRLILGGAPPLLDLAPSLQIRPG